MSSSPSAVCRDTSETSERQTFDVSRHPGRRFLFAVVHLQPQDPILTSLKPLGQVPDVIVTWRDPLRILLPSCLGCEVACHPDRAMTNRLWPHASPRITKKAPSALQHRHEPAYDSLIDALESTPLLLPSVPGLTACRSDKCRLAWRKQELSSIEASDASHVAFSAAGIRLDSVRGWPAFPRAGTFTCRYSPVWGSHLLVQSVYARVPPDPSGWELSSASCTSHMAVSLQPLSAPKGHLEDARSFTGIQR